MSRKRDTDTLTQIDLGPDQPTIRQGFAGSEDETHKIDPRAYAPLRVCPECSLAWEITGEWCPSCGTAFEKSVRDSSTATRVMPRRPGEPPLNRSARRRAGAAPAPQLVKQSPRRAPQQKSTGSMARNTLLAILVVFGMAGAFILGQSTRQSQAEVDRSIDQAVSTAKQSAANSYKKAFDEMQAQAATAIEAARKKGVAEGQANAQSQIEAQQQDSQSLFDNVTQCVLHGQC